MFKLHEYLCSKYMPGVCGGQEMVLESLELKS